MFTRSGSNKDSSIQTDRIITEQSLKDNIMSESSNGEEITDSNSQNFVPPTLNIHMHVQNPDLNNIKLFLPRIQLIIHLYFDDIAKKLEGIVKEQNQKSLIKSFQNLLEKRSPKVNLIKFHFKPNSEGNNNENTAIRNENPGTSSGSCYDAEVSKNSNDESVDIQNVVYESEVANAAESHDNKNGHSNCKNHCKSQDLSAYKFDKNIKLKNAVIVLIDICKNKKYYHLLKVSSAKNQNSESESSCNGKDVETTYQPNQNSCFNANQNEGSECQNHCENQDLSAYKFDKNIKLKNAVIVLTDICKSKKYYHLLKGSSAKNQNSENESLHNFKDRETKYQPNQNSCFNANQNEGSECQNHYENQDLSAYKFDKNIKLKNAVIVLIDICKNKKYYHLLKDCSLKKENDENKSLYNFNDKEYRTCEDLEEFSVNFFKEENDSCVFEPLNPYRCKNNSDISDNCPTDINNISSQIKSESCLEEIHNSQNLTLSENCGFSDFSCRFQKKCEEYLLESAEYFHNINNSVICDTNNDIYEFKSNNKERETNFVEQSFDIDIKELDENKIVFKEENSELSESELDITVNPYFFKTKSKTKETDFTIPLDVLKKGEKFYYVQKNLGEIHTEFPENHHNSDVEVSDGLYEDIPSHMDSRKEVSSDAFWDMDLAEPDSSNVRSNSECKNQCAEVTIKKNYLPGPDFQFLVEKETQKTSQEASDMGKIHKSLEARKLSGIHSSYSDDSIQLLKKRKNSNNNNKKKNSNNIKKKDSNKSEKNDLNKSKSCGKKFKFAQTEDYIPLNASGPTIFAVAASHKVTPFKAHEARDFKTKMLFRKRIKRFSNPDQLEIYKLKRKAIQKALNKNKKEIF